MDDATVSEAEADRPVPDDAAAALESLIAQLTRRRITALTHNVIRGLPRPFSRDAIDDLVGVRLRVVKTNLTSWHSRSTRG